MDNVMIDCETLGTKPGYAILSLGAVAFDPGSGELGSKYYSVINLRSQVDLKVDPATLDWWGKQSAEARRIFDEEANAPDLRTVLYGFTEYLKVVGDLAEIKVWSNGAAFDQPILAAAYDAVGLPVPWKFYNSRCHRTIKNLGPELPALTLVKHHALEDAIAQVGELVFILDQIAHGADVILK